MVYLRKFRWLFNLIAQETHTMPHRILSLAQAARHIRIPERELFHLVQREEIPFIRHGEEICFEHRLLDDWAQKRILGLPTGSLTRHHREEVADRTKRASEDALIQRLFRPQWIETSLHSRTKPGVIRDMVALAVKTGLLYDDAALQREIEERELASSTAIGDGAAFLHARYHDPYHASESFVVLGRSLQHIFFGAQDGEPTDIFFLICCTDAALHLHTLARLCMMAHGTMMLSDLRAAADAEEMYKVLDRAEREILKAL